VAALTFTQARETVLRELRAAALTPSVETTGLTSSANRILAEDVSADRDSPPFNRSMRDGFAIRAADLPGRVTLIGEVRAGQTFPGEVHPGQAVEIMTGAPVPAGADAVVMVEHCTRHNDNTIYTDRAHAPGDNISPRGCEARSGAILLPRGTRLDYASIACLASVGRTSAAVYVRPHVAILSTGYEIVSIDEPPSADQIRNSNAWSLAVQVERAGGIPIILPIARDTKEHTRNLIQQGLTADLLLISGGVSAGKYDVVEVVMAELNATFFFDRVLIQPGQPAVFGKARNQFFFGLPGNPASTMVTFEIFARAAIGLLSGATDTSLPFALARLTQPFRHRPGLTRFLPAICRDAEVTPVSWHGSGDIPALCRANAYLVADPERAEYAAGDLISILIK
jgi:molybdopterin molybdotransferase